jgi:hypothetical protein
VSERLNKIEVMKRGENKKELKDTGRGSFGMHAAEGGGEELGAGGGGGRGEMMKRVNSDAISNKITEIIDEVVEDDATATIRDTIPYSLRSGKKKRAGKRKKDEDEEDDEETREMRTKRVNIRGGCLVSAFLRHHFVLLYKRY